MKKTKWILLCLCAALTLFFALSVSADTYGKLTYTVSNGEVTITDCNTSASGAMTIPAKINGYPVTSIGEYAFRGCSGLTSITIPSSVTSIGSYAFYSCSGLTSITIPASVTSIGDGAFSGCSKLTSIEIPSGVTSIGNYAFNNCSGLTSVTIPSGVTSIGDGAFSGCSSLTSITVDEANPAYSSDTQGVLYNKDKNVLICCPGGKAKCTIPSSVTSIGGRAFSGCSGLTSITIPSGVTSIGDWAFSNCRKLTSITIPSGVTSIGDGAFSGCSGLTSITIPSSVTSIGNAAFSGCSGLQNTVGNLIYIRTTDNPYFYLQDTTSTSITSCEINANCKFIGGPAFSNCSKLTSIKIPSSVKSIGVGAFYYCSSLISITVDAANPAYSNDAQGVLYNKDKTTLICCPGGKTECEIPSGMTSIGNYAFFSCSGLTSITIPSSVTHIGGGAFNNCSGLTSITIPSSVTHIGGGAFNNCSSLTSIEIPSSVTSIGGSAFYGCSGLTSIEIPSSVTSIGNYAFFSCSGLTSIEIPSSVTSIGEYAFYNCSGLTSITILNSDCEIYDSSYTISDTATIYGYAGSTAETYAKKYNRTFVALSHTHTPGEIPAVPATCTASGLTAGVKCSVCGAVLTAQEVVPALGHTEVELPAVPATCTESGLAAGVKCGVCGEVLAPQEVIPAGHTEVILPAVPATCTENGLTAGVKCGVCGEVLAPQEVIPAGHTEVILPAVPATCTENGLTAGVKCGVCGEVLAPQEVIPAGHTEVILPAVPATCTENGLTAGVKCGVCGEILTAQEPIPALLTYKISDGKVTITDCDTSATGALIIPAQIEGYPVTSIGDYAFGGCSGLTSIEIPSSVTSIGDYAFGGCRGLTSITIPSSVTSIWHWAFEECSGLKAVYITDLAAWCGISFGNGSSNPCSYAHNLYLNNTLLTDLVIPSSVTSIWHWAFDGCSSLTSVTFAEGSQCTSIEYWAFEDCSGLTSIEIPSSVTSIGKSAFYNCSELTSITVDAANPAYSSDAQGVLYNKDKTTLICCPGGKTECTIPSSVTSIGESAFSGCSGLQNTVGNLIYIQTTDNPYFYLLDTTSTDITSCEINANCKFIGDYAFYYCSGLTSVTFAEGSQCTSIGADAFFGCSGLTSITIPSSVTSIGDGAFLGCSGLTSITIPSSVTSIGYSAFEYCESLTSIEIPSSVTSIGADAFFGCSGLTSVTFAEGSQCTSIGQGAFSYCRGLTSITIPSSVTSIGYRAFEKCSGLENTVGNLIYIQTTDNPYFYLQDFYLQGTTSTDITSCEINANCKFIGDGAFLGCSGLTSITIPSSVTSIGDYAFGGCSGLTSITIPSSVTSIGYGAFRGCSGLTSITIPSSVTSIGDGAFYGCSALTSIEIPSSVTSIGESAFSGCSGLTSITIPSSVTSIGDGAFYYCSGLTSITIPSSVTSIGEWAFESCSSLTSITIWNADCSIYYFSDTIPENATIYGRADSTAQAYAQQYNRTFGIATCAHPDFDVEVTDKPTCTAAGYGRFTCKICGDVFDDAIPALGHDYVLSVTAKAPTCTANGVGRYACSRCGGTKVDVIPALGHTPVEISAVPATCTEDGATSGVKCEICNEILTAPTVIPATGHTEVVLPAVAATCTESGLTAGSRCSVCGTILVEQEVIPATGHTVVVILATPATCTESGVSAGLKCSVCNEILLVQNTIPALGHDYQITETYLEATPEMPGIGLFTCTRCGETKYDDIPYVEPQNVMYTEATAATCTTAGNLEYWYCEDNGVYYKDEQLTETYADGEWILPATGEHDYVKGALVAPTMEKDAYYTYTCSVCGDSYEETVAPTGAAITLSQQVQVGAEYKIAIGVPKVPTGTTAHWMVFTQNTYDPEAPVIETVVSAATGTRVFYSPGIPAPRMNDSLTARYYRITNGVKYVSAITKSCNLVDYYNDRVAAGADALLIRALEAMLNYGSAAQINFAYNTEIVEEDEHSGLVNRHIPEANRKSAAADFASIEAANAIVKAGDTSGKGLTYYSMSAQVKQRINLAIAYKRVNKSLDKSTLTFRGTYIDAQDVEKTVTVSGENFVASGSNYYSVYIDTIPAKDLRCMITGAIYDANDVQVSDTITTSLESYVVNALGGSNENLKAVCLATLGYSDAIAAYVNK